MGQILIRAKSGDVADAARALEAITPVDVMGLKPGPPALRAVHQ
jgi:aminomethyltransferase